jgi:hypothetical protein
VRARELRLVEVAQFARRLPAHQHLEVAFVDVLGPLAVNEIAIESLYGLGSEVQPELPRKRRCTACSVSICTFVLVKQVK